ncbi:UV-stimulated scaffold protein A-like protein [Raphanus sativus]|uniref:UV-stimulated scaffold protein A homolog n=1 Tax=Raphanus sativus TaxID=3726 RepID=A0A6J0KD35_RAPSA|nr:UV-stimulated scaffold protein A homolog [Raphanus sativus]XP_018444913.2 UV-stimulated scaffold protein A homolog [Raphanus sativus]XP_018444914.2 UV-stimulated scaffold protein A homolog [Raphanus sativus]KAJ4884879.1 UV-stimulated scaffold protein A-like protein [Raphanus sativus]
MEARDEDAGGKVIGLIERATKPSAQEVDPRLLKAIKSTLRYSDSEVRLGAKTLMELMKHNHSQVRLLTLLIIDELFMRSKLFRTLIVEKFDQLLSLSVGFRTSLPLPAPPAVATVLRTKAIEFLEKWNLSFGLHYKEIRLGFDHLKNTLKLKFPDLQANAARRQREALERETRTKEILRGKFESLRDGFGVLKGEIEETIKEIKEGLEIVQWRGDDGVPLAILDEEDYEEIRCSHLRQIRMDSLMQSDKVEETSENRVVFDVLREQGKLLMKKHLVSVQDGISLLIRVDVSDNRTRDSMLKELIDIRNSILATEKKCEQAGFTISRMIDTGEKEEEEEDIWEEDDGKVVTDPVKKVAPLRRVQNGEGSSFRSPSEANRSTSEPSSNKASSSKTVGRSGDTLRDKLISEAPVVNWGSQLSSWDSTTEARANHRGLEVENHWGRVDQDAVIPADKIAELNLQATVYREERTEIPPCHAPLKKGGLCQRRDLRACPFHGPIVPRDNEGNPIIKESPLDHESENQTSSSSGINQEDDVPMDETTSDSDPNQLARQIAKQALKNIREKDREELRKKAKRAKHAKVKEHNFSVLRDAALASTSKSAVIDEEFDRVFAERKNKKQTFSLTRRKKTTAKDRISERLLSNRAKGTKPKQLPQGNDDEKHRETSANQW